MSMSRIKFTAKGIAVAVMLCAPLLVLFLCNPAEHRIFSPCPLHRLTGLYCSGCGSLRAAHLLLHGNLAGALRMNPLMVFLLPIVGLLALRPSPAYPKWMPWAALAILILYGIARNIPLWPFILLAPN
jgi:hypothetical protein